MSQSDQKLVQYLGEAHAKEIGLLTVLQSQIAITPRGSYRDGLEKHLEETRDHARRLQQRLRELDGGRSPLQVFIGFTEMLVNQTIALGRTPFGLLRGSGGEERMLKNAKDAYATEALEIATYTVLERFATNVCDESTATLAASIRADEERMLERIMRALSTLTDAVVAAEVEGDPSYAISETRAADAVHGVVDEVKQAAHETQARVRRMVTNARKVPGVGQVEGEVRGIVASEEDLAIPRYDSLTAEEIIGKLHRLSQIELAMLDSYEQSNDKRTTVLNRISALRHQEPWPGYDELTIAEIEAVLEDADEQQAEDVAAYERAHKNRAGVLRSAEREPLTPEHGFCADGAKPPRPRNAAKAGLAGTALRGHGCCGAAPSTGTHNRAKLTAVGPEGPRRPRQRRWRWPARRELSLGCWSRLVERSRVVVERRARP